MKKGSRMSDETRMKISAAMRGRFVTEESRLKMSMAKSGVERNYRSELWRENISAALKGRKRKPMSDATKAKLGVRMKERWDFIKAQEIAINERGTQAEVNAEGRGIIAQP